ncbi:hypothetical protein DOTSEDRAFT_71609 [Dothistroma septosporum NZE10]|uniref:Meiotically up-regulated protein Msb1/Mug8 domain-containing protein n=1 Tax=Dothistroma septosporum (strain NZE10 / CBS 128990) TaxID=675120 RepID=N1PN78_DOTSN|nr:hypothetical protein DOTSEDRAFT_71609 [Dothistroma septosporum NZE10]
MPLFSRFKNKGAQPATKSKNLDTGNGSLEPSRPRGYQSRWESTAIVPEEVQELVHVCTAEMKSRAEALDAPFFLLPFRPDSDPAGGRTFIRSYYRSNADRSSQYKGESLKQELRLTDSVVLCSIMKWCWSRMPGGVVSWPVYEGFRLGEKEAKLARNAFDTFIPIGVDSEARRSIIFDFYDLLSAIAAHGKSNGLTGRKVSRLAGWWAFEHTDNGQGFEGGYKSWSAAADASGHLFFAYLRSLSPDTEPSLNVIERIPRSLQALVASTEYPPETPTLLQRSTPRVVMLVDTVSPTPFALLRRAKNFEYRDRDRVLREFAEFEDPIDALTEENKRVLNAVAIANQQTVARSRQGLAAPEESWSAFQNLGFADLDEQALSQKSPTSMNGSTNTVGQGLREQPLSRNGRAGRPTTPSWADFLSSGFADDGSAKSPTLLYPPAQVLPPLGSRSSSPGLGNEESLAPGELAAITNIELDDAFWWVWMTSLAGEEPNQRKAVFGRCALVETTIMGNRWLIMEEQVKGASPDPAVEAYIVPKKSFLSTFTKRSRFGRKEKESKQQSQQQPQTVLSATPSKTSISTDQHAKIKAAARAMNQKQDSSDIEIARRGRNEDVAASKTNSMLTLGLQSEAGPAMQWAKSYDKNAIRQQYLGDSFAGKGMSREDLGPSKASSINVAGANVNHSPAASPAPPTVAAFEPVAFEPVQRDLPAVPTDGSPAHAPPPPLMNEFVEPQLNTEQTYLHQPEEISPPVAPGTSSSAPAEPLVDSPQVASAAPEAPIMPRTQPALAIDSGAFEKGLQIESPSPASATRVGRKALPRQDDHPAFRPQTREEPKSQQQAPGNPAALAARKAMLEKAAAGSDHNKLRKPVATGGAFKKMFGKKKDSPGRDVSLDLQTHSDHGLAPPAESGIGRRISLMRKKHSNTTVPRSAAAVAAQHAAGVMDHPMPVSQQYHDHSQAPLSRDSINEHRAAEHEFSRFDQGPPHDMPAMEPRYSEEVSPAPISEPEPEPVLEQPRFNTLAASRLYPQAGAGATEPLPFDAPISDNESEASLIDPHDPQIAQDRWATIRDNAQKRAERYKQERASEDQSTRPSQSVRSQTDDGETSGEETIESRVARIKARVAELTGNMDASSAARH